MIYLDILLLSIVPALILGFIIYKKDKICPEPPKELLKAFGYGVGSVFLLVPFTAVLVILEHAGLYSDTYTTIGEAFANAFFGAAIPEELAKFAMLWLFLRKCKYFDEYFDGIVYASMVALGFAAFENILYLFDNQDSYVGVGITRSLLAVPGHLCDGILMGYYYSLFVFKEKGKLKNGILTLVAPILAHGIYDALIFSAHTVPEWVAGLIILGFLAFCVSLWISAHRRIKAHQKRDSYNPPDLFKERQAEKALEEQQKDISGYVANVEEKADETTNGTTNDNPS